MRPGAAWRVVVVLGGVEALRQVALRADGIALGAQALAVRVVAIGADHAGALHAALAEAAPFEDLAEDLAVGVVEAGVEQGRRVGVEETRTGQRVGGDRAGAGVAGGADLGLRLGLPRRTFPMGDAARVVLGETPGAA